MELVLSAGADLAADKDGQRVKGATAPMVAMDSTVVLKVIVRNHVVTRVYLSAMGVYQ